MSANSKHFTAAILLWLVVLILIAGLCVQFLILPGMEAGWRAQGIQQLPWYWQILIDIADLCGHRGGYVLLPSFVLALFYTVKCARERNRSLSL